MTKAIVRSILAASLAIWIGIAALAQQGPDYSEWENLATRAESVLTDQRASTAAFEDLRTDIVNYRASFLSAQSDNTSRISTLQSQIEALGPVPDTGSEPDEIASRRAELTEQLARLQAPVRRAEEAFSRADGLIREIDRLIRERQTNALLELGPSPLNPTVWTPAVDALIGAINRPFSELRTALDSDIKRLEFRGNLPLVLVLVAFAVVMVTRGGRWVVRVVDYMRNMTQRGTGVWSFFISLGQIILPFIGLLALTEAFSATGLFGLRGQELLDYVPVGGLLILTIRWLADQSFSPDTSVATIRLDSGRKAEARWYFNLLGVLLVVRGTLSALANVEGLAETTVAVIEFPILTTTALILFRLGQILTTLGAAGDGDSLTLSNEDSGQLRLSLARLLGRASILIAVAGPVLSGIGYGNVGTALVYPAVLTLILCALVLVLQRFVGDLYQLAAGETATRDSLIPVLANFALTICALPALVLIWGARVADLTELWSTFLNGFQFGSTRISPLDFLTFAVVFTLGYSATRLLQKGLRGSVLPKTKIDPGGQTAIVSGLGYVGIFLSAIIAISAAGLNLSSLAIVAGALSVGIGFGLQTIVQNFVSGIILLIERPIAEGDWVEVGPHMGIVKDISVRSTRIETFDRTDVIVPNADFISGTVTNYTRGNTIGRVMISVGVAYGTDTRRVADMLLRIVREHEYVLTNPEPSVVFARFGADALEFEVRAILRDVNKKLLVLSDVNHQIAELFGKEGIEIPFAQRDVWLRNPETLAQAKPADPQGDPA